MPKIEIKEPESAFEAGLFVFSGAFYLLLGKKDKRSWAFIGWSIVTLVYFGLVEPAAKAWMTERVKIEVAQPLSASPTSSLSLFSMAYAGEQYAGEPIHFAGQLWGYADTNYRAFKLYGKDAVLLYDRRNERYNPLIFTVEGIEQSALQKK